MVWKMVKGVRLWYERCPFMVWKMVKGVRLWYEKCGTDDYWANER